MEKIEEQKSWLIQVHDLVATARFELRSPDSLMFSEPKLINRLKWGLEIEDFIYLIYPWDHIVKGNQMFTMLRYLSIYEEMPWGFFVPLFWFLGFFFPLCIIDEH